MDCPRHGGFMEIVDSQVVGAEPAIHTLACGCAGTVANLRDPEYLKAKPDARDIEIEELQAKLADLQKQLETKKTARSK